MDLIMPITLNVDIELPKVERKTELACKLFHFFKFMAQSTEGLPFYPLLERNKRLRSSDMPSCGGGLKTQ